METVRVPFWPTMIGFLLMVAMTFSLVGQVEEQQRDQAAAASSAPAADLVTSWGTHFVFDDARVHRIHGELYDCLWREANDEGLSLRETRQAVQACEATYWDDINITDSPPTFYGLSTQTQDGDDLYEEFTLCSHFLVTPMWDLPPETTTEDFRESIRDCLAEFPSKP